MQVMDIQPMLLLNYGLAVMEPMDCQFEEEDIALSSASVADTKFDLIIGHIEDIIVGDEFQALQNDFMEKYYMEFEDTEENKFIYTDIHKEYTELIEKHIEKELSERIPDFSMEEFTQQLQERKDELDGEVFEMLLTFSDFMTFKEMFIDYRASKEGRVVDFSDGITIKSVAVDCTFPTLEIQGAKGTTNPFSL